MPSQCNRTECFDPLVRNCVSCELFHTPDTGQTSSLEPGTALQPQEGSGLRPDVALFFGAPALLGLVLALTLVGLVSLVGWRWRRQQLRMASPDTSEGVQQGENCVWGSARAKAARGGGGVGSAATCSD